MKEKIKIELTLTELENIMTQLGELPHYQYKFYDYDKLINYFEKEIKKQLKKKEVQK